MVKNKNVRNTRMKDRKVLKEKKNEVHFLIKSHYSRVLILLAYAEIQYVKSLITKGLPSTANSECFCALAVNSFSILM